VDVAILGVMIPIVAIVMGIGIGMMKLALDYRNRREMFKLHHAERLAAIEKGVEVAPLPPEFFQTYRRPAPGGASSLRWGLIWLFVGSALCVGLYYGSGHEDAWWGLMPAALGAALLVYYFIAGRKFEDDAGKPGTSADSAMDSGPRLGSKP
jgi:hypothetical protein